MKICFWGDISGALRGNTCGGGELQIALLAKALARGGHEVVIVDFQTSEDFTTDDGIKVIKIKGWNKGIRIIRTLTHRLPQLYSSLKAQKADVYYCRIRDFRHIFVYWAARKVKAKFILAIASDLDIVNFRTRWRQFYLSSLRNLWGFFDGLFIEIVYPWLLSKSDFVFVQHEGQKQILLQKGMKSTLFPNLIDLTQIPVKSKLIHNDFIYVGWLDKRKGIREFFELVEKSPSHSFTVIGPPRDKIGYMCYEKLKSFGNVTLLGELSHTETLHHISYARALISTSPMEGFPNIFIEAWACGIPVLSLYFDPGGIIKREGLGEVANGNLNNLISEMDNMVFTEEFASRAIAYVEDHHALNNKKIIFLNETFNEITKK